MLDKPFLMRASSCQANLTLGIEMIQPRKQLQGAGLGYLGAGIAFLVVAASGQPAFLGVGMAFIGLGIAFIAKARKDKQP
ncbi:MAG TPA: hypothetical protein PL007_05730 [Thermomonas sp.]|nr:hypothetical protein [Thermomonas sp.]HRA56383.1 hypothetical protein [Thermomonas sp.]